MTFYRGQKVVCVGTDDQHKSLWEKVSHDWTRFWHPYTSPVLGDVYTIANIYTAPNGRLKLELVEISDGDPKVWAPGFNASGFRPVVSRTTDISALKALLNPAKQREDA